MCSSKAMTVIVLMDPLVVIKMGRLLGEAGDASLINQVMQHSLPPDGTE